MELQLLHVLILLFPVLCGYADEGVEDRQAKEENDDRAQVEPVGVWNRVDLFREVEESIEIVKGEQQGLSQRSIVRLDQIEIRARKLTCSLAIHAEPVPLVEVIEYGQDRFGQRAAGDDLIGFVDKLVDDRCWLLNGRGERTKETLDEIPGEKGLLLADVHVDDFRDEDEKP